VLRAAGAWDTGVMFKKASALLFCILGSRRRATRM